VAELADAADSKSVILNRCVGSTPTFGTAEKKLDSTPAGENERKKNQVTGQAIGQDPGQRGESPRGALIAALTSAVRDAAAAGDLGAARVAHEALGRLLSEPGAASAVVDLNVERERRR
jgi:hypothetical protein